MVGTSNLGSWNGRWSWFGQIPAVDAQTAVLKKLFQSTSHTHTYILFVYETTVYIYICVCKYIYMALFENWITNDTHSTGSYHYLMNMVILEISPCSKSWFRISPLNSFSVYELPSGSGHSNGLLFKWMNMAQLWMIYDDLPIQMIKLMIKKGLLSTAFIGLPKVYTFSESLKQYSLTTWLW